MEKFKIQASQTNKIENNIIEIVPDIVSSDIPYYAEIETLNNTIIKLRNAFISNEEQKNNLSIDKIEFKVGNKSGKVYEISLLEAIPSNQLENSLKKFLKDIIEVSFDKKSRFYNNVKFSTELLKDLNRKVSSRDITDDLTQEKLEY